MARLVLGPLLRYVDDTTATIWVETDVPCDVTVRAARAAGEVIEATGRTFTVHGHHYALVDVEGLEPGGSYPYDVALSGAPVWPPVDSTFPASRIRTVDPAGSVRLTVGSCRRDGPHDEGGVAHFGIDALRAHGRHLATLDESRWPSSLLLIGDQVYADAPPAPMREIIAGHRDPDRPPGWEVADFEEYTQLYRFSWSDPVVRWVLSTVPSMMIFDDHDIRDDWNISRDWLQRIEAEPWWRDRLIGGLGTYWIYQHLGNLAPKQRASDPLLTALREDEHGDAPADGGVILDTLTQQADEARDARWSFARDIGDTRLIVLDSRGGRVLEPRERLMLGPRQLGWFDDLARGDIDHLVIATSIPYLLPSGIHHLEAWNEALCDGAWGRLMAARAEKLRQAFDLEHWASFQRSFAAVANIVTEVAQGARGRSPASITFLSGDVHYSYLARATEPTCASPIHQVVTSPIRNALPRKLRWACRVASHGAIGVFGGALARAAGVHSTPLSWRLTHGTWFDNVLATLELNDRRATVRWEAPYAEPGEPHHAASGLQALASADLSG